MASYSKKRKNVDTKQSFCFGKYLQEEFDQKTKVQIRLFSYPTDIDKTVYKRRAGLLNTGDSDINCSIYTDLFFKKQQNVKTSTTVTKIKKFTWDWMEAVL